MYCVKISTQKKDLQMLSSFYSQLKSAKTHSLVLFVFLCVASCKTRKGNNSASPEPKPNPVGTNTETEVKPPILNTSNTASYAAMAPLLAQYCVQCHKGMFASKNVTLDTLQGVQTHAAKSAVQLSSGQMPPAGVKKLPANDQANLVAWLQAGAPEFETNTSPTTTTTNPEPAVPRIRYSRDVSTPSGESLLGTHCQKCHNETAGKNAAYGNVSLIAKTTTEPKTTDHVATLALVREHLPASLKILKGESSVYSQNAHKGTLANLRTEKELAVFQKWLEEGALE
jgi:mono/diheme cytochrome c family protein